MDQKQQLAELRAQHRRLANFTVAGLLIAFKAPSREEWDTAQKKLRSDKHVKSAAIRELCQQALVTSPEDFQAAIKKKPAFPAVACERIGALAGRENDSITVVNNGDETATLALADGRQWRFNAPDFDAWEDCQEQLARGKNERETIFRELSIRCASDAKGLDAFFEEYPAGHEAIANVLTVLAGGDIEGEVKKG